MTRMEIHITRGNGKGLIQQPGQKDKMKQNISEGQMSDQDKIFKAKDTAGRTTDARRQAPSTFRQERRI